LDLNVLIVDDEPFISDLIARRIRKEAPHFSIAVVESGTECLEYLNSNHVDCILSDYQMPGMDGMELLVALRLRGDTIPFIFITAQGNEELAREAFKNGAYDYFTKESGFAHFARITNSVEQGVRRHKAEISKLKTEDALRRSEERMFKAQRMAHVGNWELDIQNNRLYWSDEIYRIYGRDPESFVPTFEAVGKAMHPDDLEPFLDAVKAMVARRIPLDMDYRLIRPDGTVRTVHTLGEATYDQEGRPVSEAGTLQDVTERKRTEESLRLFRELLDRTNDAIFVNDPRTGLFITINDKACENLGYCRDELLSMRVMDIEANFPEQSEWDAHVHEVKSKGHLILNGTHRRADGTVFPVEVNVTYMNLGDKDYMVAVARDISGR